MDPAAKTWIRKYKKLFDQVAAANAGMNASENVGADNRVLKVLGKVVDDNGTTATKVPDKVIKRIGKIVDENSEIDVKDDKITENSQKTPLNEKKSPLTSTNDKNMHDSGSDYAGIEEFTTPKNISWINVAYDDSETKAKITSDLHKRMIDDGLIVKISDETSTEVKKSYPDLQGMKKKERLPILKESFKQLKANLRAFLTGLKNNNFEFEVNGSILEAKLYNVGIDEVMKNVTQEKAEMLYTTENIFKNAKYLYSTPDYDNNTNVYRWNYFYTPVQIGDNIVGVRIAIRDMAKQGDSQIYHWGIKKDTSLGGVRDDYKNRKSNDASSDVSTDNIIPDSEEKINTFDKNSSKNVDSSGRSALKSDSDYKSKIEAKANEKIAKAKERAEARAEKQIETEKVKLRADYETDTVFDQTSVNKSLGEVAAFKTLPKKVQSDIGRRIFLEMNKSDSPEWRRAAEIEFTVEIADKILLTPGNGYDVTSVLDRRKLNEEISEVMKRISESGRKSAKVKLEGELRQEIRTEENMLKGH